MSASAPVSRRASPGSGLAAGRAPGPGVSAAPRTAVGASPAFVCTEIRQRGPLGTPPEQCTKQCPISRAMGAADAAWRASLASVTIADLVASVQGDSGPEALPRIGAWLSGSPDSSDDG